MSSDNRRTSRDDLFIRFVAGLFGLIALYGLGMLFVVLFGDEKLGLRMLTGFSSMFTGLLGLGAGYLLGQQKSDDGG